METRSGHIHKQPWIRPFKTSLEEWKLPRAAVKDPAWNPFKTSLEEWKHGAPNHNNRDITAFKTSLEEWKRIMGCPSAVVVVLLKLP